jgi:hypothetical protein
MEVCTVWNFNFSLHVYRYEVAQKKRTDFKESCSVMKLIVYFSVAYIRIDCLLLSKPKDLFSQTDDLE